MQDLFNAMKLERTPAIHLQSLLRPVRASLVCEGRFPRAALRGFAPALCPGLACFGPAGLQASQTRERERGSLRQESPRALRLCVRRRRRIDTQSTSWFLVVGCATAASQKPSTRNNEPRTTNQQPRTTFIAPDCQTVPTQSNSLVRVPQPMPAVGSDLRGCFQSGSSPEVCSLRGLPARH